MLHYIEKSSKENVTNQDIAELDELVQKVKHDREVGVAYMKSWEHEKMIRMEEREEESRDFVLYFLEDLGPVPADIAETIRSERDIATLHRWGKAAAKAESMEEFRRMLEQTSVSS